MSMLCHYNDYCGNLPMSRTSEVRDIGVFDLSFFKYDLSKDILEVSHIQYITNNFK